MIKRLEKLIIGKIISIKSGKITSKESGIGTLMFKLKELDEPLYLKLLERYNNDCTERE